MMKRSVIAAVVLSAGVMGVTACGSNESPTPAANSEVVDTVNQASNTGHIGDTLYVRTEDPTNYGVGTQGFTVTAPTGNLTVRLAVEQSNGSGYLGNFTALTDQGTRLKNNPATSTVPVSGKMVVGEIRRGVLVFDVPAGEHVTKIFHDQAYNVDAEWDL